MRSDQAESAAPSVAGVGSYCLDQPTGQANYGTNH